MTQCCPTCHAPYRASRVGIYMPILKSELFDSIKMAGDVGISSRELIVMHYQSKMVQLNTIKIHVYQINDLLVETDYRICSDGRGANARWYLSYSGARPNLTTINRESATG